VIAKLNIQKMPIGHLHRMRNSTIYHNDNNLLISGLCCFNDGSGSDSANKIVNPFTFRIDGILMLGFSDHSFLFRMICTPLVWFGGQGASGVLKLPLAYPPILQ
jgi:hypothetical protein